ncbi:unnamed protein product [Blepharisma stoltei]|uniref:ATP-dependent RNA helicase n=1 Tax=Blepharisma stoltei TaxID=1481888 RepID=A0AAU9JLW4_9CILI|nr:unnamed protein product [Blepharisma stoltei]
MSNWEELGLNPTLSQIISEKFGFAKPTPVQKAGIPLFIGNKDICVESCTGSGKTLTFLLPIFHKLMEQGPIKGTFGIILAPARELANQIHEVAVKINENLENPYSLQCLIGGHSKPEDIEKIENQGANIIIATPGRILDLLNISDLIILKDLGVLVLDEADRLLDLGFKESIHFVIDKLPKQRRTGLFSATMTTQVEELIKAGLRNPAYITIKVKSQISSTKSGSVKHELPKGLTNYYMSFHNYLEKLPALCNFLIAHQEERIIIFFATCASTNFYKCLLSRLPQLNRLKIMRLHGQMKQNQREKVYKEFDESEKGVLLTTDLIARGIDFPNVNWIIQYDPPQNPDFFVHRIGRTARANKIGQTLIFLIENELTFLEFMRLRNIDLENTSVGLDFDHDQASQTVIEDREVYDKAQRAFVAYIRYYKEHQLHYIFELKHLDIGFLARSFYLLRIPRVKEILGKEIPNFIQSDIDPSTITYKDPIKESIRQKELKRKEEELLEKQKAKQKLNKKSEKFPRKRSRTEKREAKRKAIEEDWDELGAEERIIKKIKKGKMTDPDVVNYIEGCPKIKSLFRKKKH